MEPAASPATPSSAASTSEAAAQAAVWIGPGLPLPASELRWRFSRSSGPGGQNVNRTDSRVELLFPLASTASLPPLLRQRALRRLQSRLVDGQLLVVAQEHRSQWRNRQAALERLAALLREAITPPPPPRRPTRPTRASVRRRLDAKQRRSAVKRSRGGSGIQGDD